MSFLLKVMAGNVEATSGKIKTQEPIKISWSIGNGSMDISVDGIDYATISGVDSVEDVNLDLVKEWVEETYYDGDYKSDAYSPARLNKSNFQ